jgi:hypothetical protein
MKDTSVLVAGIEYKVRKLIEINRKLQLENKELTKINAEYKLEIEKLTGLNQQITDNLNNKIITNTLGSETEVDESRKIIQALMREVDQCIALLNK